MKNICCIIVIYIGLISCSNNNSDTETEYQSTGKIHGQDMTLCVCWCGGFVIEINGESESFRFSGTFPENIDVSTENLPLDVKFNWELTECNQINITEIEEI